LSQGQAVKSAAANSSAKKTKPPQRFTEGTLIQAMANVHKFLDDAAQKKQLKETDGIGTNATRAGIIETLKQRAFVEVKGKHIVSTATGRQLIEALPPTVTSAASTALMERDLAAIAAGELDAAQFLRRIENQVTDLIIQIRDTGALKIIGNGEVHKCPQCGSAMRLKKGKNGNFWSCSGYPKCTQTADDKGGKPVFKAAKPKLEQPSEGKTCPACGKPMMLRTGPRGNFWGCSGFPKCKKTLPA
jgi:DNA topoisomerase-3